MTVPPTPASKQTTQQFALTALAEGGLIVGVSLIVIGPLLVFAVSQFV